MLQLCLAHNDREYRHRNDNIKGCFVFKLYLDHPVDEQSALQYSQKTQLMLLLCDYFNILIDLNLLTTYM